MLSMKAHVQPVRLLWRGLTLQYTFHPLLTQKDLVQLDCTHSLC